MLYQIVLCKHANNSDEINESYYNKGNQKIMFIDSTQKIKVTLVSNK